jgi:hypothetical protein
MNKVIFRLFILTKIAQIESVSKTCTSVEELHRMEGKLEVLRELFDDFNLEYHPDEELEFHNKI